MFKTRWQMIANIFDANERRRIKSNWQFIFGELQILQMTVQIKLVVVQVSIARSIPIFNFHFNFIAVYHQKNASGSRENEREKLREKGALLRYKNNLEIHIKTNKVKHFRPLLKSRAKEMERKILLEKSEKKIKITKKGANRVKYHRLPASKIFSKLVNYQFAFKQRREKIKNLQQLLHIASLTIIKLKFILLPLLFKKCAVYMNAQLMSEY